VAPAIAGEQTPHPETIMQPKDGGAEEDGSTGDWYMRGSSNGTEIQSQSVTRGGRAFTPLPRLLSKT